MTESEQAEELSGKFTDVYIEKEIRQIPIFEKSVHLTDNMVV